MDKAANDSNDPASGDSSIIKLAGREFESISQALTANQDDYLVAHLRLAGALEVLADLDVEKPRSERERAEYLLTRILLSGRKHFILAGCLTEKGKVWSRPEADRNAEIFSQITDTAEKSAMSTAVVRFVSGFFTSGETSSQNSPKSSRRPEKGRHTASEARGTSETSPN
jgi:hypothetical protein